MTKNDFVAAVEQRIQELRKQREEMGLVKWCSLHPVIQSTQVRALVEVLGEFLTAERSV